MVLKQNFEKDNPAETVRGFFIRRNIKCIVRLALRTRICAEIVSPAFRGTIPQSLSNKLSEHEKINEESGLLLRKPLSHARIVCKPSSVLDDHLS